MSRLSVPGVVLLLLLGPADEDLLRRADSEFDSRSFAGLLEAERLYEEVIGLDADDPRGHAGLAATRCLIALYSIASPREALTGAKEAALRAVELAPELSAPQAALGLVAYLMDRDWNEAELRFVRSLDLDPGNASGGHWYAMFLTSQGRYSESLAVLDRALQAAPDSLLLQTKRGTILTAAGLFDEAASQLEKVTRESSSYALAWRERGFNELARGRPEAALPFFAQAVALAGGASSSSGGLAHTLARVGKSQEAKGILDDLLDRSQSEFVPGMYLALIYAGFDDREAALDWLESAERQGDPGLVYARVKPGLESLHDEARFIALMGRLGLPDPERFPVAVLVD